MPDSKSNTTRPTCPACGWVEPFWQDTVPPTGCLYGISAPCPETIARATAAANRRKFCPEAFDRGGNILPDGWAKIFAKQRSLTHSA